METRLPESPILAILELVFACQQRPISRAHDEYKVDCNRNQGYSIRASGTVAKMTRIRLKTNASEEALDMKDKNVVVNVKPNSSYTLTKGRTAAVNRTP